MGATYGTACGCDVDEQGIDVEDIPVPKNESALPQIESEPAPPPTKPVREGDIELTRVFECTLEVSSEHSGGGMPAPIKEACRWLMIHGQGLIDHEGLFRIPGRASSVKAWIEEFNYNPATVLPENESVDTVTSFVINYFKQLKDDSGAKGQQNLWKSRDGAYNMQNEVQPFATLKQMADDTWVNPLSAQWVKDALSNLSPVQVGIFRDLTAVMRAACSEELMAIYPRKLSKEQEAIYQRNRMDPRKFAMCAFPTIMAAVEIMITEHDFVFGEAPVGAEWFRGQQMSPSNLAETDVVNAPKEDKSEAASKAAEAEAWKEAAKADVATQELAAARAPNQEK